MATWIVAVIELASFCVVLGMFVWARRYLRRLFAEMCDEVEEAAFQRGFKAGYRCRDDAREVWCPDGELLEITRRN